MENSFGYSSDQWAAAKNEATRILQVQAARGLTICYSDLSKKLTSAYIDPHGTAMSALLGQISTEEYSRGRGMLSVIVVHKTGDQKPGKGFFECAEELGKNVSDFDAVWIEQINAVFDHWSR